VRPTLFHSVIPFERALAIVLEAALPVDRTVSVALSDADTRVVAEDVAAPFDVPSFDRAAMDGYAVIAGDTEGASAVNVKPLRLAGGVFTGETPAHGISPGECMEVSTGAPLPPGATAVVTVEDTSRSGEIVSVAAAVRDGQHIGRRGADITAGQSVAATGDVLTPSRVGALAAVGRSAVAVFDRPSVTVLSTGNEVVVPGVAIDAGQVYDINQFTLGAVVRRHGGVVRALPPAGDTVEALERSLDRGLSSDVVVFSGGSSVGGRDLLVDVIGARGDVLFHGIAVKPGKPTLFGKVGRTLVFGMPGYPTSCLSNAYMLLLPLVRKMARLPAWSPHTITVPLARRVRSTPDRHQFYTVRVSDGRAEPAFKASGDITSMAHADGYIEIPIGVDAVEAGTTVTVTLFQ
jgi:molybdenum cofactor synthesis domain-containing protein